MPLLRITVQFALRRELTNIFVGYILQKNNRKGHVVEYNHKYTTLLMSMLKFIFDSGVASHVHKRRMAIVTMVHPYTSVCKKKKIYIYIQICQSFCLLYYIQPQSLIL